ncbi:MAG: MBL fold metallo-hydrolase [Sedimentisphaerales bacterium]|nr:MBL fold metallo-hydrolase [Sedimentisphaerales bacterium]
MLTCSLQSGSSGNCIYVETSDARLLFDAGISGRTAQKRLAQFDRDIHDVDALFISHNHSDHVDSAGVYSRKFSLPVYITTGSWRLARKKLGTIENLQLFSPGQTLTINQTRIITVPTAHDGVEGVAFIIQQDGKSLGIFTDLGHRFAGLDKWIAGLDALYLESNYDPDMLDRGDYPTWLKKRVSGSTGHLSNFEAAHLVRECAVNLQFLVLSHLSENNNVPDLALNTAREVLGPEMNIALAHRNQASEMFVLS